MSADLVDPTSLAEGAQTADAVAPPPSEVAVLAEAAGVPDPDAPISREVTVGGLRAIVQVMRTRQLLRLLKVITNGAPFGMAMLSAEGDDDEDAGFGARLLALLWVAIPEAEEATLGFLASMVELSPEETEGKTGKELLEIQGRFSRALQNPEVDETFDLIGRIIELEKPNLALLGKRLAVLLRMQGQ